MVKQQKMDMKKELDKLVTKCRPAIQKTGVQLSRALKTAEEDIAKMYKVAQMHVEVQMKNLEKEKLYYDIGKEVASKLAKGEMEGAGLDKYRGRLEKIAASSDRIKKKLSRAGKAAKGKKAS